MSESAPELLQFFKALADETRLKMTGLLARQGLSGEQLAVILGIKPATVSHHLSKLAEAGLVTSRTEGHSKYYELRFDAIREMAGQLRQKDFLPQVIVEPGLEPGDRKVVADYSNRDGTLKRIPAHRTKLFSVLRHILRGFAPGRPYKEKQVNAILARFHPDTASLRRAMIDCKLMVREAGIYWRREGAPLQ
jgi:biotin operon repressor